MKQIQWIPRGDVKPYERNPRKNENAVAKLVASIREFGWQQPIVVDEAGIILAGHTRLLAAEQLDHETVPVVVAEGLDESQRNAYRLADNRLAEYASWDEELLQAELRDLKLTDFDLALTGFSVGQLRRFTDEQPDEKPPEPDAKIPERCKPGDLWVMGEHRLKVGDATNRDHVREALGPDFNRLMMVTDAPTPTDEESLMLVTDPPYGVNYDPESLGRKGRKLENDDRADWRQAWDLFPGDVAYVWHSGLHAHTVAESLTHAGFDIRAQIVWRKPSGAMSQGHYHWQHEPCYYAVRHGRSAHWSGSRNETTVWDVPPDAYGEERTGHPTQKPVDCMLRPMRNHEIRTVYDPFLGSGSTLIAAQHEGRRCVGLEIDPRWADAILHRWETFTGEKARKPRGRRQKA